MIRSRRFAEVGKEQFDVSRYTWKFQMSEKEVNSARLSFLGAYIPMIH
jgi:hypothetical protein